MILNRINTCFLNTAFTAVVVTLLSACNSQPGNENKDEKDSTLVQDTAFLVPRQSVIYSLPSPVQFGRLLQRAGATYDKALLNSSENATNYSSKGKKALNMGVYVADLSYSATFSKAQETILYVKSTKKLADELGISGAFSEDVMKRMEANSGNRDSILPLISEILINSTSSLTENEQSSISALAISGGFIEGLFIGTQVTKKIKKNESLVTRLAEMKGPLNNLVSLLSETKSDEPELASVLNELKALKQIYDETQSEAGNSGVKADTSANKGTIGGGNKYILSKDQLDRISSKVEALRLEIIKI